MKQEKKRRRTDNQSLEKKEEEDRKSVNHSRSWLLYQEEQRLANLLPEDSVASHFFVDAKEGGREEIHSDVTCYVCSGNKQCVRRVIIAYA